MNSIPKIGDKFLRNDSTICEITLIGKSHIEFKYIICGPELKHVVKVGSYNFLSKEKFFELYKAIPGIAYPDE